MDYTIKSMIFAKNQQGSNGRFIKAPIQTRIDAKTRDRSTGQLSPDSSAWEYASLAKPELDDAVRVARQKEALADRAEEDAMNGKIGPDRARGMRATADKLNHIATNRAIEYDEVMDDIKSQPADPHEMTMYSLAHGGN